MTMTRTWTLTGTMLVLALGAGACGGSDEDAVRAAAKQWTELDASKDPERACKLLTPRAKGLVVGALGSFIGADTCVGVMRKSESDESDLSARDIDKAKIAIRDDLAVLTAGRGDDVQRIGLKKVDGDWKLDNPFNPSLDEQPRRVDPRLSKGTDEQQLRATYGALGRAFAAKDYERACALFSYAVEGQLAFGRAFASLADTEPQDKSPDLSCAGTLRALAKLGDGDGDLAFPSSAPSAGELAAAKVTIRGDRATVSVPGEEAGRFVREEGQWRVAAEKSEGFTTEATPSAASLERCWRQAGAAIATSARELRFAVGDTASNVAISPGRVSVKATDWRIFYTLPSGGEDPGLATVLAKPSSVRAVAYVRDAPAHAGIVAKARACGD